MLSVRHPCFTSTIQSYIWVAYLQRINACQPWRVVTAKRIAKSNNVILISIWPRLKRKRKKRETTDEFKEHNNIIRQNLST